MKGTTERQCWDARRSPFENRRAESEKGCGKMAGKRKVIQGLTYDRSFATDCGLCIPVLVSIAPIIQAPNIGNGVSMLFNWLCRNVCEVRTFNRPKNWSEGRAPSWRCTTMTTEKKVYGRQEKEKKGANKKFTTFARKPQRAFCISQVSQLR